MVLNRKLKSSGALDFHPARIALVTLAAVGFATALSIVSVNEAGAAAKTGSPPAAQRALSAVGNFQAGLDARQIKSGRSIFVGYCAECHVLFDPTWYAPEDWERLFSNMSGRAKLNRTQAEDLRSFIRTVRGAE